ncbi:MAG: Do family serine endopeptidase [Alphaproteobacteria bacterium]
MSPKTIAVNAEYTPLHRALLGLFAMISILIAASQADARAVPDSFTDLADQVVPSVVNISISQEVKSPFANGEEGVPELPPGVPDIFRDFRRYFEERQGPPRRAQGVGSGFIIDPSGLIITNNHVVESADEIVVIMDDGTELDAEVVGADRRTDIALLKVESEEPLPAVAFADSDDAKVGQWVMAVGSAYGLVGTVTAGIISAIDRNINAGPYDAFIQTDAAINQGNSGGPLFNMDGQVIGVNSMIYSRTGGNVGIGFAIPANQVQRVVADLREHGQVRRGWLGVGIQPVTEEIAESVGLDAAEGVMVTNVVEDDPADRAGVESGDVILEFDGEKIPDTRTLLRVVADTPTGKNTRLVVWRDGKRKALSIAVGAMKADDERPAAIASDEDGEDESEPGVVDALGMTLAAIDDEAREAFNLPDDAEGVIVAQVRRTSHAAQEGIRRGDLIVEVNRQDIDQPDDVTDAVADARKDDRKSVLVRVRRGENYLFIALRLEEDEE